MKCHKTLYGEENATTENKSSCFEADIPLSIKDLCSNGSPDAEIENGIGTSSPEEFYFDSKMPPKAFNMKAFAKQPLRALTIYEIDSECQPQELIEYTKQNSDKKLSLFISYVIPSLLVCIIISLALLKKSEKLFYIINCLSVETIIIGIFTIFLCCCFIKAFRYQKLNCCSIWKLLAPLLILVLLIYAIKECPKVLFNLFMTDIQLDLKEI